LTTKAQSESLSQHWALNQDGNEALEQQVAYGNDHEAC
jgi:hypothetical protein